MSHPIRFALVLHNHQPIGNFDDVFENAYQDSYLPFLEVFRRFEPLKVSLHTSGSLMEWMEARHGEYVDQLADLVARGRVEIIGGPYYEPILAMLPSRDRIGQTCSYTRFLEKRLGATVRGMWVPERVWEQSYVRDLVAAGMEYTVLDDFHFKAAGLDEEQLAGHFATEDDGRVMSVFPGSERLRYLIPFADPQQTIDYLGEIAQRQGDAVVVFGDDGEKFGTWPGTRKHVYEDGWLERFFTALVENADWLHTCTLADAVDHLAPRGKVYLPDCSYREMTEWALPTEKYVEFERLRCDLGGDERFERLTQFVRGGTWRNFRVKYSEANEMYARMMAVSRRLEDAMETGLAVEGREVDPAEQSQLLDRARGELYRGQCNCGYWHGAFGGIYLPHLRSAVFENLIAADTLLDRAAGRGERWVEARADDFDFDGCREIQLANGGLLALIDPARGGHLYEFDVRAVHRNLLATMTRRPEAYHLKVVEGSRQGDGHCASIHERLVFKQDGLDQRIQYDSYPRKSLVDLFYEDSASLEAVAASSARQLGDFATGPYQARIRRSPDRVQALLAREGLVDGLPVKITKGVTLRAGNSEMEIAYLLEGLPHGRPLHFAVEMNFAGLPAGAEDRYFLDGGGRRLGHLGSRLDLTDVEGLELVDEWLGLSVALRASRPTHFWTFPVETVSQSEGGFELVHQSVAVQPRWFVTGDATGRWSVTLRLACEAHRAGNPTEPHTAAAAR